MAKTCTRAEDEQALTMVRLRSKGYACATIARRLGIKRDFVNLATFKIRKQDMELSGEAVAEVAREYW